MRTETAFAHSSRGRLTARDLDRFQGGTLFDRIARAVCRGGCLPRKELYEAWEVARRVRRLLRGGRVVDVCGGHGLLAHVLLLLDDSSPDAVVVDPVVPPSALAIREQLVAEWPRIDGRITRAARSAAEFDLSAGDLVVSSHACGELADLVLERAASAGAPVAVLPCCHEKRWKSLAGERPGRPAPRSSLEGWVDRALAIDIGRVQRLEACGYDVRTQAIPRAITPKNRLLIGIPAARR